MKRTDPKAIREAGFRLTVRNGTVSASAVSDGVQALLGYAAADFLSGTVALRTLIHRDDQDIADLLFSPALQSAEGDFNIRVRQASGRILCARGHYGRAVSADRIVVDLLLQDAKSLPRTMADAATNEGFAAMMDNTDDYIYFKDRNHVMVGASHTLVALCPPARHWSDLIGQTDYDLFTEEHADAYYRLEKQIFAGIPVAAEVQEIVNSSGASGWVDNRKYPIRDASGEIVGLFGIARDISERRHLEIQQREEHARFKAVVDMAVDPIFVKDDAHRIVVANPAFCDLFGMHLDAVLGRTLAEDVPADEREHFLAIDRQVLDTGTPDQREESLTVGGRTRTIVTRKTRFVLPTGERFLAGSIRDVTEIRRATETQQQLAASDERTRLAMLSALEDQQRAAAELEASEFKYQVMFDNAPFGVFRSTPEGALVSANPALARLLGYSSPAEAIRSVVSFADQHFAESAERRREEGAAGPNGQFVQAERRYLRVDGTTWIGRAYTRTVYDASGEPQYDEGYIEDISARKQAETDLRNADAELRMRNEVLTRFNEAAVGRELRMVELKREVDALCVMLGESPRYRSVELAGPTTDTAT